MAAVSIVVAGIAGFAFGAVWYILMGKPWMAAAGVTEAQQKAAGVRPFIVGLLAMIVVAAMMRHILASGGIETIGAAAVAGGGVGAFFVLPFLAMNYAFSLRPGALWVIDGVNAIGACVAIAIVLTLF
jgi:hypothetical protein